MSVSLTAFTESRLNRRGFLKFYYTRIGLAQLEPGSGQIYKGFRVDPVVQDSI
jgi:hypothetical protein